MEWVIVGSIVAVFVGLVALRSWLDVRSTVRAYDERVASSQRSSIAGAPPGTRLRFVGQIASARRGLEAPITGRPCVYFSASANYTTGRGGLRRVGGESELVDFLIDDGSGIALVCGDKDALVVPAPSRTQWTNAASARAKEFLARLGRGTDGSFLGNWRERSHGIDEAIVEVGDEVLVVGVGELQPADTHEGTYRDAAHRLVVTAGADHPLVVIADPRIVARHRPARPP